MDSDVLPGRLFSFERYDAEDRGAYSAALRSVRRNTLNMEVWLEYVLAGLAEEYERVAATVADLSTLMVAGGDGPLPDDHAGARSPRSGSPAVRSSTDATTSVRRGSVGRLRPPTYRS